MKEGSTTWYDEGASGPSMGKDNDVGIDVGGFGNLHERGSGRSGGASSSFGGLENKIAYEVAGQMLRQAQTHAGGFLNIYSNLDLVKPYFDVELATVLRRLRASFVPSGFFSHHRSASSALPTTSMDDEEGESPEHDLYGPTMLMFTLVAILLLGMKLSNRSIQEGTLIGSAFGLCFSYVCPPINAVETSSSLMVLLIIKFIFWIVNFWLKNRLS